MAKETNQKKKKSQVGKIALFIGELILVVVLLVVFWIVIRATDEETGVEKISLDEEKIEVQMNETVKENEVMKGYRNIALFGVDSRTGDLTSKTRSDTILIASINEDTCEVKLVSLYRDTFLNEMGVPEEFGKCNASYAYGGAEQAIKMLNANLDMDITDFITIGFEGLRDVVDALDGVYIDVDSEEIQHINNYQISMVDTMSDISTYEPVSETGYQKLNGLQATAYCRIRYTAGNDFMRTARQREVIKACLDVAKTMNPATLTKICNNVFGEVYTSLSLDEILSILGEITKYKIVDETGFPKNLTTGIIGSYGDCVVPLNLADDVVWLHEFLFDEENYEASKNVKEYTQTIYDMTNSYLNGSN